MSERDKLVQDYISKKLAHDKEEEAIRKSKTICQFRTF